jgi:hypothetical protein
VTYYNGHRVVIVQKRAGVALIEYLEGPLHESRGHVLVTDLVFTDENAAGQITLREGQSE